MIKSWPSDIKSSNELVKKFIDIHFILCLKRQKYPFDNFRYCFDLASSLTIPIDVIRDSDLMDPNEQSLS